MDCRIKLNGHYDLKTIKIAKNTEIKDFGFDFRPRSFNFLQNYKFVEFLDEMYHPSHRYYLLFENETDNVLERFIKDVKEVFARRGQLENFNQQVFFEFNDFRESSFYNSLEIGFYWRVRNELALREVTSSQSLQGLILDFSMLEKLHRQNTLFQFIGNMTRTVSSISHKVEIGVDLPWDADIFPSLFEFLPIDFYDLSISSHVESSYRHIDEGKLINQLNYFRNL